MSEFSGQACVNLEILSLLTCPGDAEEAYTFTPTYSRYVPTR